MEKLIVILGETFETAEIPTVTAFVMKDREYAEAQIQSVATQWHEGSVVGAVQALENDLQYL